MKRFIYTLCLLLIGFPALAEEIEIETNVNMSNFWQKNGKSQQKVIEVASQIIRKNDLTFRVPVILEKTPKTINANAYSSSKKVGISEGLLPYIDNDDELAAVIAHEMAHVTDYYAGLGRIIAMRFNSKSYEHKADLIGIDYMVKAGYNPLAMITVGNKFMGESTWDYGNWITHPKASSRFLKEYEYIYVKYPQYLNSEMVNNIHYANWKATAQKDISQFHIKQRERASRRGNL